MASKNSHISLKRLQIDKANTIIVVSIAISAFVVVFCLVASRSLWTKQNFQNKLIGEKEVAVQQLNSNLETVDELVVAYQAFVETPENIIGGNSTGSGDRDGDNAKITLDALPSTYDFPALVTSLEKILKSNNYEIGSITGVDDEVTQATAESLEPVEMPFDLSASGGLNSIEKLLITLDASIRPIYVTSLQLSGDNSDLQATVSGKTYYQPGKTLEIKTKVVK